MPRMGRPRSNSAASTDGALGSYTDDGPPESTIARGPSARILSRPMSKGWISEYTFSSRMRRAMSCVYCDPKSRMRTSSLFIATIVRRLFGDDDVVDVRLAQSRLGDADELGARAHVVDVLRPGVAHRRLEAADQLVH